ncbi:MULTISPECIES: hypothetical protein [Streptomyces]|uniref:Uncharacterized protein n=1 Tax=Streptomyces ramulosus TaxID=47762 RepID=A0ABW1FD70_9ACTN
MAEEDLDVFPRFGVARDLAVLIALLVYGPAHVVAEGVRDRVPGIGRSPDTRSGGERRNVPPPRQGVCGRLRLSLAELGVLLTHGVEVEPKAVQGVAAQLVVTLAQRVGVDQ